MTDPLVRLDRFALVPFYRLYGGIHARRSGVSPQQTASACTSCSPAGETPILPPFGSKHVNSDSNSQLQRSCQTSTLPPPCLWQGPAKPCARRRYTQFLYNIQGLPRIYRVCDTTLGTAEPIGCREADSLAASAYRGWLLLLRQSVENPTGSCSRNSRPTRASDSVVSGLAERVGFEPTIRLRVFRFSRPARSTAPSPLRSRASYQRANATAL